MRNSSFTIFDAVNTVSSDGATIDCGQWVNASLQVIIGDDTLNGSIRVMVSNDPCPNGAGGSFEPTNWDLYDSLTATAGSNDSANLQYAPFCFRFMRIEFVRTSGGSSRVTVNASVQGV